MGFLQWTFLNTRVWILLLFLLVVGGQLVAWIYAFIKREVLFGIFYRKYFPERAIKVVIHHRSNIYRVFWRLIPDNKMFSIKRKIYNYDDKNVTREKDFFVTNSHDKNSKKSSKYPQITIDNKSYDFNEIAGIKYDKKKHIEIHYWYGNPAPIDFNFDKKKIDLSGSQLQQFKDNDLFAKLLTLDGERMMLLIVIIGMVLLLILNLLGLLKSFGFIAG